MFSSIKGGMGAHHREVSFQVPQQAQRRARTRTQAPWLHTVGSLGRLSQQVTSWNRTLFSIQSSLSLRATEMELNL